MCDDSFFTARTLSAYIQMPTTWIYDQVMFKKIPYQKVGRLLRFRRSEIEAWLAETHYPAVDRLPAPRKRKTA